ncbi:MAG: ATP-binding protein [Azospirillaceae bacterium]|nr:ATP-binding protein [Azospirillaceae bacterium]
MEFELRVAADSAAIPGVLDRLEAFAEAAELSPRVSHRLALVCEELATNVATHGRAGYPPATFTDLRVALTETELRIRVEDDGPPFDLLSLDVPDTESPLDTRQDGGLGIHLIRSLAREIHYRRVEPHNRIDIVLDLAG